MSHVYFMTGFPGFISNQLIRQLIKTDREFYKAYMLVMPSMIDKANEEIRMILREFNLPEGSIKTIKGDITKKDLELQETINSNHITHVFHLAAIYDLAVPETVAYNINVNGTKNVNEWVKSLTSLKRYVYFSTAYVAGMREGKLYENELLRPPTFKNHYEKTKYEAEVLVEQLKSQLPVTIIRPGIVKGHSVTGATNKFDGPYFILNFLDSLSFLPIKPYIGKGNAKINLVPIDFIIQSVAYVSFYDGGKGKTYHLTDPNPYTASQVYDMFVQELFEQRPIGRLPLSLSKAFLSISTVRKWLQVEKEALDYFTWKGDFDCQQAKRDLATAGIICPDFKDGVPAMVKFFLENKENKQYQIQIR
ncbi:SDR family oxidoreductase [Peribacillus acanthi]|uniref:SDR family oxidoreductase n=1 Tax=Peribacillus acanthi TaxID=2171554 RepID=UPI000D3E9B05|nr:SDR family oxidoreductase [Peribacillus acanthi]